MTMLRVKLKIIRFREWYIGKWKDYYFKYRYADYRYIPRIMAVWYVFKDLIFFIFAPYHTVFDREGGTRTYQIKGKTRKSVRFYVRGRNYKRWCDKGKLPKHFDADAVWRNDV